MRLSKDQTSILQILADSIHGILSFETIIRRACRRKMHIENARKALVSLISKGVIFESEGGSLMVASTDSNVQAIMKTGGFHLTFK